MVYFPNCTIQIYEPSESQTLNPYTGEPEDTWTLVATVSADFQQTSNQETQTEYGKVLEDQFDVFVDLSTTISDKSIIKIVGETKTYDVIGTPQKWNRFLNFKKIVVREHRKPVL